KFLNFIILPFNDKYVLFHNKKGQSPGWFQLLMTLFQLLNFSLFIFLALKAFGALPDWSPLWTFFGVLGALSLFLLAKAALQAFTGFVFNSGELIMGIIFSKLSYLNHSGIVLCVANLFLAYILKDSKALVYV